MTNELVARVANIRQLVLEDIVAPRSISVFVEHHSGPCTACVMETGGNKVRFEFKKHFTAEHFSCLISPNMCSHVKAECRMF